MTSDWIITYDKVRGNGLKQQHVFDATQADVTLEDAVFLKKLAKELQILALSRLSYEALVTLEQDGLRVKGKVSARATQACSLTLAPVDEKIDEAFNILFLPNAQDPNVDFEMPEDIHAFLESDDPPEPLVNNQINLYEILREFTALGLNPFPRAEGAVFEQPPEDNNISPFAALAQIPLAQPQSKS